MTRCTFVLIIGGQLSALAGGHDLNLLKYPQGENQSKRQHSLILHRYLPG